MNKVVFTGSYNNCKTGNLISISGDKGLKVGFEGQSITSLAPKKDFWNIWHSNIGVIPDMENNLYYLYEFYNEVLKKQDPEEVIEQLENHSILLCYEDNLEFCHRHVIAFWLEHFLGIETNEVKVDERGIITAIERPEYLKEQLETIIKESYPMHNFESIRAAYLYNKAKKLEQDYFQIEMESFE